MDNSCQSISKISRFFLILFSISLTSCYDPNSWSKKELNTLASLIIQVQKEEVTPNAHKNRKASFGHKLFFDQRLSNNGKVACSNCHIPSLFFTDGLKLATAGLATSRRHTPTIVGLSNSPWLLWDGSKDSLWSQALAPLENPKEHGSSRVEIVNVILTHHKETYEKVFGAPPNHLGTNEINTVFVNIGKAIAAYEEKLHPKRSRFDRFVSALLNNSPSARFILSSNEIAGLKVFISEHKGRCIRCHNGPMFTNFEFASTLISDNSGDNGREDGVTLVLNDEFNCYSKFSNISRNDCEELNFTKQSGNELKSAFKVPTLRNITYTAPYMHNGQLKTLKEVLTHYNSPPISAKTHTDIIQLNLSSIELMQLEAFLSTLSGDVSLDKAWLQNPFTP